MLACDEGAQVIRLIEQFPADIQATSPSLAYVRGLCAWPHYQYGAVRSAMERAASGFEALGRNRDAQRARAVQALAMFFCGQMPDARSLSQAVRSQPMDRDTETLSELFNFWYEAYHGPIDGPGHRLARVVDLLMQGASAELWFRCITRVNILISRPRVSAQIQRLVNGARAVAGDGQWSLQASANLTEAWLLLWQGRIAELEAAFQRMEEDSRWLGQPPGLRIRLLTLKVMYHVSCDDKDAVRATRDAIIEHVSLLERSGEMPLLYLSVAVRASAAIEDWPTVRTHLPAFNTGVGHENPSMRMFLSTFKAQLALHEGRIGEALTLLRELVADRPCSTPTASMPR